MIALVQNEFDQNVAFRFRVFERVSESDDNQQRTQNDFGAIDSHPFGVDGDLTSSSSTPKIPILIFLV